MDVLYTHMYNNGCNIIGDNIDVYSKVWVVAMYIYILHCALRYLQYMCDCGAFFTVVVQVRWCL